MRLVMFCHSLVSDWNHGNAHFLRGVTRDLLARGHEVDVYEPIDSWSRLHLVAEHGLDPIVQFNAVYPDLASTAYDLQTLDLDDALEGADAVIVHEWNDPELVRRIGAHRRDGGDYVLLFHDTHHRAVTAPHEIARFDLRWFDGVLAFGSILRDLYLDRGWARRAWTWHEAADTSVFYPMGMGDPDLGLVWIGNWGDGERSEELREFLIDPVARIGLAAEVHGVRWPPDALADLERAGIRFRGWLPNVDVPAAFARARATVHVPRRPYAEALPGIPTIRVFEALACGIPLVCAPWSDAEHLFRPGQDYLVAADGREMEKHLRAILADQSLARTLIANGLETITNRHTCAHRVDELLDILAQFGLDPEDEPVLIDAEEDLIP